MRERLPRAIVFDVEGTLIDCVPQVLKSWQESLELFGHRFTLQELQRYSGMDGADILDRLLPRVSRSSKESILKQQGDRYRQRFMGEARPFPGVRDVVLGLREAGCSIGIATACQPDELAVYDSTMHLLELSDATVCGGEVKHGKPHPDLFRIVLGRLRLFDPSCVLVVGDSPYDAIGAKAMGLQAAGVLTGGFSRKDLRAAGCSIVLRQVTNLAVAKIIRRKHSSSVLATPLRPGLR